MEKYKNKTVKKKKILLKMANNNTTISFKQKRYGMMHLNVQKNHMNKNYF